MPAAVYQVTSCTIFQMTQIGYVTGHFPRAKGFNSAMGQGQTTSWNLMRRQQQVSTMEAGNFNVYCHCESIMILISRALWGLMMDQAVGLISPAK